MECNQGHWKARDPAFICNTETGQWVKVTGRIGARILARLQENEARVRQPAGGRRCNPDHPSARDPRYICNPQTGQWVLRTGAVGKRILQHRPQAQPQRGRVCDPNHWKARDRKYICNPQTGQWVLRTGAVGKRIQQGAARRSPRRSPRRSARRARRRSPGQPVMGPNRIECARRCRKPGTFCDYSVGECVGARSARGREIRPLDDCVLRGEVEDYDRASLIELARSCGIPGRYLHDKIYDKIDYNQRRKCQNDTTLLGDSIDDIAPEEIIRVNGNCYPIGELAQYMISNELKNSDPFVPQMRLWKSEKEKEKIINHHGMELGTREEIKRIKRRLESERERVLLKPDAEAIINQIIFTGWVCICDQPGSFAREGFVYSGKALTGLRSVVRESEYEEDWMEVQDTRNRNLNKIFDTIENSCIHGVGFSLLGLAGFLYRKARDIGIYIGLTTLIEEDSTTSIHTFEIHNASGLDTNPNDLRIKYVTITGSSSRADRAGLKRMSVSQRDRFIAAYIDAKELLE